VDNDDKKAVLKIVACCREEVQEVDVMVLMGPTRRWSVIFREIIMLRLRIR